LDVQLLLLALVFSFVLRRHRIPDLVLDRVPMTEVRKQGRKAHTGHSKCGSRLVSYRIVGRLSGRVYKYYEASVMSFKGPESKNELFAQASIMKTKVTDIPMIILRSSGDGHRSAIQALTSQPDSAYKSFL
jgi:hypothetical protein